MANWYGSARSNYVRIADMGGLKRALKPFPGIEIVAEWPGPEVTGDTTGGKHALLVGEGSEDGGWPSFGLMEVEDEEGSVYEEEVEFSFIEFVMPYVEVGEVLVIMACGAEKLRYLTGFAEAYQRLADGTIRDCTVSIDDIYAKAAEAFGVGKEAISAARY